MSKKTEQVRAWKFLMEQVRDIQDPVLKRATVAEFRERALREWGWDPVTGKLQNPKLADLEPWEQELIQDVRDCKTFGFDVFEDKRKGEAEKAFMNMMEYVRDGGTLLGIPDNIRTAEIAELYFKCKDIFEKELNAQIENVKNTPVHALYEKSGITIPKNN